MKENGLHMVFFAGKTKYKQIKIKVMIEIYRFTEDAIDKTLHSKCL